MSTHDDRTPLEPLDGQAGPARPLSPAEAAAQADAVLARLSPRRPARTRVALLVAVIVLVSTGAFAAVAVMLLRERAREGVQHVPSASGSAPEITPLPAPAPAPEAAPAGGAARGSAPLRPPPQPASARDWLDVANAARAQRDFVGAERLYQRAAELHPATDDAYAASLALAELRAQHLGRPREAVALYRKLIAARPAGALAEQARVGLARAYGALGEREAEREAWQELLERHPDSWFAEEARARLGEH
jgi:tetratricopeptide (TPR) repeat protein